MTASGSRSIVAVALLAMGCGGAPAPSAKPEPKPKPNAAPSAAVAAPEPAQKPVHPAVAKLHRSAFDKPTDAELGRLLCVITIHDPLLERGEFYPAMLFASGNVATWRQTLNGGEQMFVAHLTAEEQAYAAELVAAIPRERGAAREAFAPSAIVVGVSTREGERIDSLFFHHDEVPDALGRLMALVKRRLEAENAAP